MNIKTQAEFQNPAATAEELTAFEKTFAIKLPQNSVALLREFAGARLSENIHNNHEEVSIQKFLSFGRDEDSVEKTYVKFLDRIPNGMMPIANAEGGNLLLLALSSGEVYFWDHELEDYDEFSDGSEACVKLANCLSEFLDDLKPYEAKPSSAKILSVKIDPAFAAKFGLKLPT